MTAFILFCPRHKVKKLAEATGIFHLARHNTAEGLRVLEDGNPVIVDENCITGWRAPEGTKALYIEGFPDDPATRNQSEGRYRRTFIQKLQRLRRLPKRVTFPIEDSSEK